MSSNGKINHDLNQPQTPPSEEDIKTIPVSNISNSSLHPVTDESKEPKTVDADEGNGPQLRGSSICILLAALCLSLFLVNVEVTIVSTSLEAITNDLGGFSQFGWLISGYLATYSSLIVIWAKLSDIFGRKSTLIGVVALFTLFSVGCGVSRSMTALIICRVLQGIGAAGCYSMAMVVFFEAVPPRWYGEGGGVLTGFIALATLVGPLLGGVISERTTWRWIFLLNAPLGVLTIFMLWISIPSGFPHHNRLGPRKSLRERLCSNESWKRVDSPGVILLMAATIFLITALLQGGDGNASWSSAQVVTLLVFSALAWIGFAAWERFITNSTTRGTEPIFPWRFVYNRVWVGMLLTSFLCGLPFNIIVVGLTQRLQNVNGMSSGGAGVRLIAYSLAGPLSSILTTVSAKKSGIPIMFFLVLGSSLQVIGGSLLCTLPDSTATVPAQYGYEILAGLGLGVTFGILMLGVPFAVEKRDLATATGAMIQIRMLGGAIGLAASSAILNGYTSSHLSSFLSPEQLSSIMQSSNSVSSLPPALQEATRKWFAGGFTQQMILVAASAGVSLLTALIVGPKKRLVAV